MESIVNGLPEERVRSFERLRRAAGALSECNKALIRASSEPELLNSICDLIVRTGGYPLAWIGLPEHDESASVRPVAHAGTGEGYLNSLNLSWNDCERGRGPTGTCIRTRSVCVIPDLMNSPEFAPWREQAGMMGFASSISLPLISGPDLFGVLSIYAAEPDAFDEDEVNLLAGLSENLAFGIQAIRSRIEREKADLKLRELSLAVEQSASIIIITDRSGNIEYVNPKFTRVTGYESEEVLGANCRMLKSGETTAEEYRSLWNNITSGREWRGEFRNRRRNGEVYWVSASISPMRSPEGAITNFVAIQEDVTEMKRAQIELEQAREAAEAATRSKSEFLARMSHEIRTPMNAIIGMTGLMLDSGLTIEQREFAEIIRTSSESLLAIINDILDFSKIESNRLELEEQPFNLRQCMEEALEVLAPQASGKGIDLAYIIDGGTPASVTGDVTRLRQILVNLVGNGVKFTSSGEVVVTASARPAGPGLCDLKFEVRDTGIGIPGDLQDKLFKPFSQVDASTTRRFGGTGLGLAICTRLVELMNGSISVKSEEGKGSTFTFTVRLKAAMDGRQRLVHFYPPELAGRRALIVEDNPTNRKLLSDLVRSCGMNVTTFETGREAIAWADEGRKFDVAIIDRQIPDMDGQELGLSLSRIPGRAGSRFIMLSSIASARNRGTPWSAMIGKPIKHSQVLEVLMSTFAPQREAAAVEGSRGLAESPRKGRPALRILLAEDNVVNQKVALTMLHKLGYRADLAGNGIEAIEALRRQHYDLIFMDVQMPEMDGIEATRSIRAEWGDEGPVIVAMTANAMEEDRQKCLDAGMNDYVSKPVKLAQLEAVVLKWGEAAHTSEEDADDGSVDPRALDEFTQSQAGLDSALEILNLFLSEAETRIGVIKETASNGDMPALRMAAHSLKGSSASIGANPFSRICADIEMAAKQADAARAVGLLAGLDPEFERVTGAIRRRIARNRERLAGVD